jgi:hypothetical protein
MGNLIEIPLVQRILRELGGGKVTFERDWTLNRGNCPLTKGGTPPMEDSEGRDGVTFVIAGGPNRIAGAEGGS